jgi:tetratricopeptide (TPR) repeat protein
MNTLRASILIVGLMGGGAQTASAACQVARLAELPVTMAFLRPMLHASINGTDVKLLADSGAFFGTLSPGTAAELKLPLQPAPFGMMLKGYGGLNGLSVTRVKAFTLDTIPLKNIEFVVGGSELGPGISGVLGRNVLSIDDAEYDLANGVVRLMRPTGCGSRAMAYWSGGKPFSAIPMVPSEDRKPAAVIRVEVDGVKFNAVLGSGASTSFITLAGATRAGMPTSGPLVSDPSQSGGFGRRILRSFVSPVTAIKIGDEEIRTTKLRVVDTPPLEGDVVLGADFFLSHRIFIANSQKTVYFTYNGGPVFNLVAKPIDAPAADAPATAVASKADAAKPEETKPDVGEPTDAAGFSRRGGAFASRRDFPRAMADLDRAVAMAPDNADYVYQRATVRLANSQVFLAMADIEQTLKLRPGDPDALLTRAELRFMGHDRNAGLADVDAVAKAVPAADDIRLRLAGFYERADKLNDAIAQYNLWIPAHPDDNRHPRALNGRCWSRALLGEDLDKALSDCDTAHRLMPKNASFLDSRGLVHLRRREFDKSIADYDASLAIQPKSAWSLYGRGLAKLNAGDAAGGKADLAAAVALNPKITEETAKQGLTPPA